MSLLLAFLINPVMTGLTKLGNVIKRGWFDSVSLPFQRWRHSKKLAQVSSERETQNIEEFMINQPNQDRDLPTAFGRLRRRIRRQKEQLERQTPAPAPHLAEVDLEAQTREVATQQVDGNEEKIKEAEASIDNKPPKEGEANDLG
jgi:hypothetical protein